MSYNPVISAARRAAKQIARETGSSYQASLDTVARQAGRSDWDAYLASPAEVPVTAGDASGVVQAARADDDLYTNGPEHAHNINSIMLTGAATTPSLLAMGYALKPGVPLISSSFEINTSLASPLLMAVAFWGFATMMAVMFFNMMAVHPDVPEVGRDGHRERHSSVDLAKIMTVMAVVALAAGFLTRNEQHAQFALTSVLAGVAIVSGVIALTVPHALTRRVLALLSANGTLAAGFIVMGALIR
jgi:hypothetical protein